MKISVSDSSKSRMVTYGRKRIFGPDKSELSTHQQRITRFDEVWEADLREALERAVDENRLVKPHVVRKRLQETYFRATQYVDFSKSHYEFVYRGLLCVAQLEFQEPSRYELDQLWSFTYSDMPPDMICIRLGSEESKKRFKGLADRLGKTQQELGQEALIEKMTAVTYRLESNVQGLMRLSRQSSITYYQEALNELQGRLKRDYPETSGNDSWQSWIYGNNWLFGTQYGQPIDRQRVGFRSIPDFLFPTLDGFIDILEIKKPTHKVIRADGSHPCSFAWSSEANRAIGQVVNYMHEIELHQLELARNINREYSGMMGGELYTVKPRAFILIGWSDDWDSKKKEAFRKLNYSLHGIEVLTYTDLIQRAISLITLYTQHAA